MSETRTAGVRHVAGAVYRLLASLKLAVVLIVLLAAVLAWATFMEAARGREYAQWYVYGSRWFIALLGLLGVNILAATLIRFPWRWRQLGFLITHAGLLVLLFGSIQTFVAGIDGQLSFVEGTAADAILLFGRSRLKMVAQGPRGARTTEFSFSPGPVDWPDGKPLDFGRTDGLELKVLKFYRHARHEASWVADEAGSGGPAIKLRLIDSPRQTYGDFWCAANPFGNRAAAGKPTFQLQQAPVASMVEDFLRPPDSPLGPKGVLSVHYQGQIYPVAVDQNVSKTVPVGDSGLAIEIVGYYANAVFEGGGRFRSLGSRPQNPMVQLQIHLPGRNDPIPEIAYAKNPFVSFALLRGKPGPVTFWYHHPGVPVPPGAEFLQAPDGKLYCRVAVGGAYEARGEVNQGDQIEIAPGFQASILRYVPHARQKVTFYPVELAPGETEGPEAAVQLEVAAGGQRRKIWLERNDQQLGTSRLETPQGPLQVSFEYERLPLGFSLKLIDFERGVNPGGMGNASFASEVQLTDHALDLDKQQRISMNEPLVHGKFTFYQSGFQELPDGRELSVLSVAYDPGRLLKYLGCLMICGGIFFMFYLKTPLHRGKPAAASRSSGAGKKGRRRSKNGRRPADENTERAVDRRSEARCADVG